jgi:hypothetical protein
MQPTGPDGCMPYAAWRAYQANAERKDAALHEGHSEEDAKKMATVPDWERSAGKLPEDITSSGESSKVENQ